MSDGNMQATPENTSVEQLVFSIIHHGDDMCQNGSSHLYLKAMDSLVQHWSKYSKTELRIILDSIQEATKEMDFEWEDAN